MTPIPPHNELRVYNPLSAGRRHARRMALMGLIATAGTALVFFVAQQNLAPSLAAVLGGMGVVVGTWIAALIALGGRVQGAGLAFSRLLLGTGTKWSVVIAAMLLGVANQLPVFPLLIGVIVATLAPLAAEILNLRN